MRRLPLALAVLVTLISGAHAQAPPAAASPAPDAGAVTRPAAPRPPQRRAKAPTTASAAKVTVVNARSTPVTALTLLAEGRTIKRAKPLPAGQRAVLTLPKMKGCMISVAATFQDGEATDSGEIDACKEKSIRLTE